MKIEKIQIKQFFGLLESKEIFWEERLVQPIDIYEEYRSQPFRHTQEKTSQGSKNDLSINAFFLFIITDEGYIGISGPFDESIAYIIKNELSQHIINQDPLAIEYLWDVMHRRSVHGRQGNNMIAISAVDNALWDLKGNYYQTPVYKILGGPTRKSVPAYASMLGFNVEDMGLVRERAKEFKFQGYTAQKWFFRHGPMSGYEGLQKNIKLVETLRVELGDDYDIMLDCWQSMDVNYLLKLTKYIEEFNPRWLEEVAMPDRIDSYRKIKNSTSIPISGGEHHYTRWGLNEFIKAEALDILQPDIYWAGGLSEVIKIANVATTADLITIPHGHSTNAGIHFSLSQSPIHTPYQEYLIKWNLVHQHFLKKPVLPINGNINIPNHNGLGMEIDDNKVEKVKIF
tara:strand:- start:1206 stop:2402 length:1197 start_codon:yes stop_codon:yes gene_type:complete